MSGLFAATALWLGAVAAGSPATFSVTIPIDKRMAHVEASFELTRPFIQISEGSYSEGVDGGLAGFIDNLSVSLSDGTSVTAESPKDGRWHISAPPGASVTVEYDVRLEHDKQRWPFGADEIAYTTDDAVFFISRTLLLYPPGVAESRVRFLVPDSWRVVTPWNPVDGETFAYDVADEQSLAESCVFAGEFIEREIRAEETVVALAMGRPLEPYADSLDEGLRKCVPTFRDLFEDSPTSRYLAVVNVNPAGPISDGSAYANSISMLTSKKLEGANYDQAIYTLAHEILHLWNGNRMRPAEQLEWFREGFTDYLTWRILTNENLIEEKAVLSQLRRQVNAYMNLDRTVSLAAAGERKSENRVLIYEGGSLFALCLDAKIREHSDGARSFTDFMKAMYAQSAKQNTPYDAALIVAVANEIAGENLGPFFDRYVNGTEALPLEDSLAAFGLGAERKSTGNRVSVNITPDEAVKGGRAVARDAFLGRS